MATTFLEPGGDATFNVAATTAGGFWNATPVEVALIATDFVHGAHVKSIKYDASNNRHNTTPNGVVSDSGGRLSLYIYFNALPDATSQLFALKTSGGGSTIINLRITTAGVLQLFESVNQIGSDGATLSTGIWYRISLAYTITNTTTNRFELFVDAVSSISVTNATITNTTSSTFRIGNISTNATLDFRTSDHYVDDSASLTDTGNIWVTAKRPNANGTTNGFTGSGAGSGYGTGNSVYVNERPLATGSFVSVVGAGSAVTEEYNIESTSTGDIDISTQTIVDYVGWYYMSSLVGETVQMILNNVQTGKAITSTNKMYTNIASSDSYPAGTGTDIGIVTDTSLTTVSLFETGVMVAYTPPPQWNVVIS